MEKLEKALRKVEPRMDELKPLIEKPIYQGLLLVESKIYSGGTSIKYWM
jgi:hypothetical protein